MINFGVASTVDANSVNTGYPICTSTGAQAQQAFSYVDVGEALYQEIRGVSSGTGTTFTVLDVFEADELGPDHYAQPMPQLWDTRRVGAVALQ